MNKKSIIIILCFVLCVLTLSISCDRDYARFPTLQNDSDNEIVYDGRTSSSQDKDSIYLTAKIVGINDGDTVEALYNGELLMKVRLAHIDAPEKRNAQPFGKASKKALSDLCFNQNVTLVSEGEGERDKYGRLIAVIKNEYGINCNRQMLRLGMAWHFKKYSDNKDYALLEDEARQKKVGLWRDEYPVAPWNWRKR